MVISILYYRNLIHKSGISRKIRNLQYVDFVSFLSETY